VSSEQDLSKIDLTLLSDDAEMMILRRLAQFPRLIEASALAHEPHRVAFYLYDLASDFHALWNKGKDDPKLRFVLEDNPAITAARRVLVQAIVGVLKHGLSLLGVSAPDEMR
jgi:arginyl-tRNA synthetase